MAFRPRAKRGAAADTATRARLFLLVSCSATGTRLLVLAEPAQRAGALFHGQDDAVAACARAGAARAGAGDVPADLGDVEQVLVLRLQPARRVRVAALHEPLVGGAVG